MFVCQVLGLDHKRGAFSLLYELAAVAVVVAGDSSVSSYQHDSSALLRRNSDYSHCYDESQVSLHHVYYHGIGEGVAGIHEIATHLFLLRLHYHYRLPLFHNRRIAAYQDM